MRTRPQTGWYGTHGVSVMSATTHTGDYEDESVALLNVSSTQRYVARADIWNDKMPFNPFPGNVEIQSRSNFENLWIFIYRDIDSNTGNSFCKKKYDINGDTVANVENSIFYKSFVLSVTFIPPWCTDNYTVKSYTYKYTYSFHSSFCVLNFMLPQCRPNIAEAASTTNDWAGLLYMNHKHRSKYSVSSWTMPEQFLRR
jgi:hypothetical protein